MKPQDRHKHKLADQRYHILVKKHPSTGVDTPEDWVIGPQITLLQDIRDTLQDIRDEMRENNRILRVTFGVEREKT